jgi:hypothetical protein
MTMVHKPRRSVNCRTRVIGIVVVAGWVSLSAALAVAEEAPVHFLHAGAMPPGAIGRQQLMRGGPLPGYFQPVEIRAPEGAQISMAADGAFREPQSGRVTAGMLIGAVYRLRVTNIPLREGLEVFPTIEVVDRLYPPVGQEGRFPIPIELTAEELDLAIEGKFVVRVIYLEDPEAVLPVAEDPDQQSYFEAALGDNPLEVADRIGRPMAILRMGGRLPEAEGPDDAFLFGSPPWLRFQPAAVERAIVPPPARALRAPAPEPPAPPMDDSADSIPARRTRPVIWSGTAMPGEWQRDVMDDSIAARPPSPPIRKPLLISGPTTNPQQVTR